MTDDPKDAKAGGAIEQVDLPSDGELAEYPLAGDVNVELSVPETVKIDMVDRRDVRAYEEWAIVLGLLLNFTVGFVVAWIQSGAIANVMLACSILFGALATVAGSFVYRKKKLLDAKTRNVAYRLKRSR